MIDHAGLKPAPVAVTAPESISQQLWREVNFMVALFDDKHHDQSGQLLCASDATDCQPHAWSKHGQAPSEKLRISLIMASIKVHFERHLDSLQAYSPCTDCKHGPRDND